MLSKEIKDEIFRLPEHEKRHLIEEIWDSIDSIPAHHERILKERLESYESDKSNAVTLEEFHNRVENFATRIHNRFRDLGGVDLEKMPKKPIDGKRTEL